MTILQFLFNVAVGRRSGGSAWVSAMTRRIKRLCVSRTASGARWRRSGAASLHPRHQVGSCTLHYLPRLGSHTVTGPRPEPTWLSPHNPRWDFHAAYIIYNLHAWIGKKQLQIRGKRAQHCSFIIKLYGWHF